jgi:hypothetical protein
MVAGTSVFCHMSSPLLSTNPYSSYDHSNDSRTTKIIAVEHLVVVELDVGIGIVAAIDGLIDNTDVGLLVGVALGTSSKQHSSPNNS